jgi:replication factor C small subunit|nr:MAG TPA: activator clamp loader [Caudoviricetes sp.]
MAITSNPEQFLWVEKYRPRTIADTIMPERIRKQLQPMVDTKSLSNLLFVGSAGLGKCLGYDTEINIMVSAELYERMKQNKCF